MSEQGIAHSKLTDPNLHELKGASTAGVDTVPFADGNGNTSWQRVSIDKLDFTPQTQTDYTAKTIDIPEELDTLGLSAITDGVLTDGVNFTQTNKNIKELGEAYNRLVREFAMLLASHEGLVAKHNSLLASLKTLGLLTNEQ